MLNGLREGFGTTSACAENTNDECVQIPIIVNYLRVRGEYVWPGAKNALNKELPPRARRILSTGRMSIENLGTTSACAENTLTMVMVMVMFWNYLRVRGEYLSKKHGLVIDGGTTSACAENTLNELGLL